MNYQGLIGSLGKTLLIKPARKLLQDIQGQSHVTQDILQLLTGHSLKIMTVSTVVHGSCWGVTWQCIEGHIHISGLRAPQPGMCLQEQPWPVLPLWEGRGCPRAKHNRQLRQGLEMFFITAEFRNAGLELLQKSLWPQCVGCTGKAKFGSLV